MVGTEDNVLAYILLGFLFGLCFISILLINPVHCYCCFTFLFLLCVCSFLSLTPSAERVDNSRLSHPTWAMFKSLF